MEQLKRRKYKLKNKKPQKWNSSRGGGKVKNTT
jgi:hypothetical protein